MGWGQRFELGFSGLLALACLLPRFLVMFSMLPPLSKQWLPGMLRTAVAAGVALPLVPLYANKVNAMDANMLLGVLLKESLIGLLLGYFLALPFWAIEAAGTLIDNQRGASIGSSISPLTGHEETPTGDLLHQTFLAFFVVVGGLPWVLDIAYESFRLWPLLEWLPGFNSQTVPAALGLLDRLMKMTLVLSSPALIAMFLSEISLALVSRFAPQMQVFFLAMPVKSGVAFFVLMVYSVNLFDVLKGEIRGLSGVLPSLTRFLQG